MFVTLCVPVYLCAVCIIYVCVIWPPARHMCLKVPQSVDDDDAVNDDDSCAATTLGAQTEKKTKFSNLIHHPHAFSSSCKDIIYIILRYDSF